MSTHLDHVAPLRHLVKQVLHKDRTLADNVRRLRWRRKRPPQEFAAPAATPAPEVQP